jgi:hypothetical protein
MKKEGLLPPLPPSRRRIPAARNPGRRNDVLRRGVLEALRRSGRYSVIANARVPVSETARATVRRAGGGYVAAALPLEGSLDTVVVDLVVVDERNGWAGAYAFCRRGAQSPLARRRIEEDLRAAELVLRAHLDQILPVPIKTVTVGIIDGSADPDQADDLTVAACEIADLFEIDFENPEPESFDPDEAAARPPGDARRSSSGSCTCDRHRESSGAGDRDHEGSGEGRTRGSERERLRP